MLEDGLPETAGRTFVGQSERLGESPTVIGVDAVVRVALPTPDVVVVREKTRVVLVADLRLSDAVVNEALLSLNVIMRGTAYALS